MAGLAEYASVPSVVDVRSIFAVEAVAGGMGGLLLRERAVAPYRKDYDSDDKGGPLGWPERFDISTWGLWVAREGGEPVGAAAVAWGSPGVEMLEGRMDLGVLWDLRVRGSAQRRGVGRALFEEAVRWAKLHGCKELKIETQNVNVGACRFYSRMGCSLRGIDRLAYRHCKAIQDEVMLTWQLNLGGRIECGAETEEIGNGGRDGA